MPLLGFGGHFISRCRRSAFLAFIRHAVETALRLATTDREIHRAVDGVDDHIGEGQGLAGDELFLHHLQTSAIWHGVDGIHGAVGPVVAIERTLILRGEFGTCAEYATGGRAWADVHTGGQAVFIICRPLATAAAPAEVRTAHAMVHACGAIPRRADVPFHVRIVGDHFAVRVESEVELIAEAHAEDLDRLRVPIGFANVAAGREDAPRVAIRIPHAWEDVIFTPKAHHLARLLDIVWELGVIAAVEVDAAAIGRDLHGVRAMFATALHGAQILRRVERAIALVLHPPETWLAVGRGLLVVHHVERVVRIEQTVRAADGAGDLLDLRLVTRTDGRNGHAIEAAVLVAAENATLRIRGHAHPGTLVRLWHVVD